MQRGWRRDVHIGHCEGLALREGDMRLLLLLLLQGRGRWWWRKGMKGGSVGIVVSGRWRGLGLIGGGESRVVGLVLLSIARCERVG